MSTQSQDGDRPTNQRVEGEYTFWDCPDCGEPICTWTDCPCCEWYDEEAWERALVAQEATA